MARRRVGLIGSGYRAVQSAPGAVLEGIADTADKALGLNPMPKKPTAKQLAARRRFAQMAKSGAFKRKANAARKKNAKYRRSTLGKGGATWTPEYRAKVRRVSTKVRGEMLKEGKIRSVKPLAPREQGWLSRLLKRKKNIAAGYYDEDNVFHPIRASYDYSAKRAGESSRGRGYARKGAKTKTRRRNVEQGFYDATGFHPIRASKDYDVDRADEIHEYRTPKGRPRTRKQYVASKRKKKNPKRRVAAVGYRKTQQGKKRVAAVGYRKTQRGRKKVPNGRAFNAFRGRPVRKVISSFAANGTPRDLKEAGGLVDMKLRGGKRVNFNPARVKLCYRGNKLYICGARFRKTNPPGDVDYGEILTIAYVADKPHIESDGKMRTYEHRFGEEGGIRPHLVVDHEGAPIIAGGSYTVPTEGIRD